MLGGIPIALALALSAAPAVGAAPANGEARAPETTPPRAGLPDLTRVAQGVLPAVVGIVTTQAAADAPAGGDALKDLFDHFHREGPRKGLATGFVVHPDGYVVTNAHVVDDASRIEVEIGDDEERVPARVVGRDDPTDVALLKIEAGRQLPVLQLGDSDRLQIAEWVMVVGNPFGLSHSVTLGIVSHTGRAEIAPAGRDGYYDFIQTDASINPGNSGGPLVNLRGEVVGIATAINATGQGIGFAVPINMAKEILAQLRDHGRVVRSWMGISVRESKTSPDAPQAHRREVVVTNVVSGGPAAASGLRVGDVITGFDGRGIPSAARLRWFVATAGVGRAVSLTVRRGAAQQFLRVELGEAPSGQPSLASTPGGDPPAP